MELEPRTTAPVHATGAVEFVPLAALAGDVTFRLREEGDVAALAGSIGRLGQLLPVELRPLPGAREGGPRWQVVAGFRRIAALRLLMRERVLARIHRTLDDDDAWGIALGQALLTEPLDAAALEALRGRLAAGGQAPWADELLDEALVRAPVDPALRERFYEFLGGAAAPEGEARDEDEATAVAAEAEDRVPATGLAEPGPERGSESSSAAPEEEGGDVEVTPEELAEDVATRLYQVNADLAVAFDAWADLPPEGRRMILEQARWIAELVPLLEREGDEE